ncbi:MAG: SRPBCC family protein [Nannocystaceae bacterium]|nr:SRPBCC family protein [Nannocystaceae bacterium]
MSNDWIEAAGADSVRKVIEVAAPREIAWRVFTERMGTWWPLATHHIGKVDAVDAVLEPRAGGRWYERGKDGSTCDWGRVLLWQPTERLVLYWAIGANWQHDPALQTEVEVRFVAIGPESTRVELEHRRLDLYRDLAEQMRATLGGEGGWGALLQGFAEIAQQR